eukprot:CCRYP_001677-RA/>CCRYP_001677-RA protein AED:0.08 eAED:0.08 QI:83/1/1/1/1/1/3/137/760
MGSENMTPSSATPNPAKPALSKRQRRLQGPNPSNTWQQQPRIKSASARARAYISYAGLADDKQTSDAKNASSKKTQRASKTIDPTLDLHSPEVKFGRMLGGTDQRSRHQAVQMLRDYLRARADIGTGSGISELDLMKLWKRLWYTLYMADKVPVQDKLSQILAELMWCLSGSEEDDEYAGQLYLQMDEEVEDFLDEEDVDDEEEEDTCSFDKEMIENFKETESDEDSDGFKVLSVERVEGDEDDDSNDNENDADDVPHQEDEKHCRGAHLVSLYIATFLRTVRREWGNVDKHRVDKFYTAVRLMLSEAYKYMAKRYWNMGIVRLFNDVLYEEALSQTPNGLRYHLIDICVEELAKVNKDATVPLTEATFLDCLEPFFAMAQRVDDKNVQKRVMNSVLLKFLNEYSFVSEVAIGDESDEDDAKLLILRHVHVGTVAKFIFEIASDGDTDERYRKGLYEMHKTFIRQIRVAGRDVDTEDGKDEDEEAFCVANDDTTMDDAKEEAEPSNKSTEPVAPRSKQSKKKKKKQKQQKTDDNATNSSLVTATEITTSGEEPPTKASKKKKRKHQEDEVHVSETTASVLNTPSEEHSDDQKAKDGDSAPSTKSSKKKKRKQQETKESKTEGVDSMEFKGSNPTEVTPVPKKKKKKKLKESAPSGDSPSTANSDGAGKVCSNMKQTNVSPASSDGEGQSSTSASKRVSFGAMNQAKSHKASMKALKTLTPKVWSTANRTPDKSILIKRPESEKKEKKSSSSRKKKPKHGA